MCDGVHWIVGMGATGQSVARYFKSKNMPFSVCDTRTEVAIDPIFFGAEEVVRGHIPNLTHAKTITVSPGIPLEQTAIQDAQKLGVPVLGDLEWFAEKISGKIIGITGTNGKSTTTTLVDAMLRTAGKNSIAGGNLGTPVLDLPEDKEYYVIECSSFGLERVRRFNCVVAAFIHFAPNHLDRHGSIENYAAAKKRIYKDATICVYNADFVDTTPPADKQSMSFGAIGDVYLKSYTVYIKDKPVFELPRKWQNALYTQNILAAITIAHAVQVPVHAIEKTLHDFSSLPHRMQFVDTINNVSWINDSKGTNLAAIEHVWKNATTQNKLILLVGGQLKGEDPKTLLPLPTQRVRVIVSFGQDAAVFYNALKNTHPIQMCNTLDEAVQRAHSIAEPFDTVILVPGGTSFDAFANYSERGQKFTQLVKAL